MLHRRIVPAGTCLLAALLVASRAPGQPPSGDTDQSAQLGAAQPADAVQSFDTLELAGLQEKFEALSRKVANAVVSISASAGQVDSSSDLRQDDLNPQKLEAILSRSTRMVGTGFVIDSDGYILTNEHVVGSAESLWVTTDDRKVYPAVVIGSDPRADLAVLKIPAVGLPAVRFAPYNSVKRGQWSIALGNPYGLATEGESCMSVGVVAALDRSLTRLARTENRIYANLIQTTAQINPGNSGGPLFDLDGDVIGINTAVILPEKNTNGIGFAIPITPELMSAVHDIKEGREIVYGYLGVSVATPTADERRDAGVDSDLAVRIDSIEPHSPAEAAELKEGDLIAQINGEPVHDSDQFVRSVGASAVDADTHLVIYRDHAARTVSVRMQKRDLPAAAVTRQTRRLHWQGLLLASVPDHWPTTQPATQPSTKPPVGLIVLAVASNAHFAKDPVAQGDIVTAVAGRPVADVADLQKIINDLPLGPCDLTIANKSAPVTLLAD